MRIEDNHIVEISYELRDGGPGGELLERMDVNYPFKFFFGGGKLLPAFEDQLYGLEEGQSFDFVLKPEQAYGPRDPAQIMRLPRGAFQQAPNAVIAGNFVSLTDEDGEIHQGEILKFDEQQVWVDCNHAMAGKSLHFRGVVLHVRPASIDELVRKHYIEEDGLRRPDFGDWE